MALTTYNDKNRVVDSEKVVWYTTEYIYGDWVIEPLVESPFSEFQRQHITKVKLYHRFANKAYRYVGMDRTTALKCQADMIKLYTRHTKQSIWDGTKGPLSDFFDKNGGTVLMADIQCHDDNGLWTVTINVNEHDVRLRREYSPYWTDENNRQWE